MSTMSSFSSTLISNHGGLIATNEDDGEAVNFEDNFPSGICLPNDGTFWEEPSLASADNTISQLDQANLKTAESFQEKLDFLKLYRRHFYNKEHFNYLAIESNVGFIVMSVRYIAQDASNNSVEILLRTAEKTFWKILENYSGKMEEFNAETDNAKLVELDETTTKSRHSLTMANCSSNAPIMNPVILAKNILPTLSTDGFCPLAFRNSQLISEFDEFSLQTNFKFGVIYQRAGQHTEEEIFSNTDHSEEFERFLSIIGERVKLKGFSFYRGGLDVSSKGEKDNEAEEEQSSEESIYTKINLENHDPENSKSNCSSCCINNDNGKQSEIMFHVSTLLPFTRNDRQQLARKRHIGNDIVAIIFQENGALFNPATITSNFLHVYIIVQPVNSTRADGNSYRVITVARDGVPRFLPKIETTEGKPIAFQNTEEFRNFLLMKLVNAEVAAATYSPTFAKLQLRTRKILFDSLAREMFSHIFELFAVGGGLRSPSSLDPIKCGNMLRNTEANENQQLTSGNSKRSGSILKNIKKTFRRQRRSSSSVASQTEICSETPPGQAEQRPEIAENNADQQTCLADQSVISLAASGVSATHFFLHQATTKKTLSLPPRSNPPS